MTKHVRIVRIVRIGTYNGRDAGGFHVTTDDGESIVGGPFPTFAYAVEMCRAAGLRPITTPREGDHADDVAAGYEQVARGE